jgi:hypothetical protein
MIEYRNIPWKEAAELNSRIWRQEGGKMDAEGKAESNFFRVLIAEKMKNGNWNLKIVAK